MKIEILMISNLELSAGGRETWLNNFLYGIKKYYNEDISIDIHSLEIKNDSLVFNHTDLLNEHTEYRKNYFKLPVFIGFIIQYIFKNILKNKKKDKYIAVGGVDEVLALLFGNIIFSRKKDRVVWLRTIYTKEKGNRYPKIILKIILLIEIFLLKNFFEIIIANGEDTAEFYRKFNLNVKVIPNSVFIEKWKNSHSPINTNKLNIAFVGRLTEVKGFSYFINSIIEINKISSNFNFHVIGDGPDRFLIDNVNNIKYYGSVNNEELPSILKGIDICVALTLYDNNLGGAGVSNALIEQMAASKVIICWDNQIFRQLLDENLVYFVKQKDILGLVNVYMEINNNKVIAAEKARRSYNLALNYSMENHVCKFIDIVK